MFKILDIYLGKAIISTSALVLTTFVSLSGIIKYVEQLRHIGKGSFNLLHALYFVILTIPHDIEVFFPMAVLLGSLIALGMLAASSELVVMQAAGISKLNIVTSVLKTAIPLMIVMMALSQWGAPQAQKMAREMRAFSISGGSITSIINSVWLRDNDDFIFIAQASNDKLYAINIWQFDEHKNLQKMLFAQTAQYQDNNIWLMNKVSITNVSQENQITKETLDSYEWHASLEPDKLAIVTVKPEELPLAGLYSYVNYLKASAQDASRYELAFWHKLTQPIAIAVMMLLALSFVFGPLRSVTMGARVISGVVAGFSFHIASEFFGPLTLVYGITPIFGALAPNILVFMTAIYLLKKQ